ncbi:hypothetical protein F3087_29435, partial [Nocardia colli]
MSIDLPAGVQWLSYLAGSAWPKGDEDKMFSIDDAFQTAATQLEGLIDQLRAACDTASANYSGPNADKMKQQFDLFFSGDSSVASMASSMRQLGSSAHEMGVSIEHTKVQVIATLVMLAAEIAYLLTTWFGAAMVPPLKAAAESVLASIGRSLLTKLQAHAAWMAARPMWQLAAISGGIQGVLGVASEAAIQGWQKGQGHIGGINLGQVFIAGATGFAGGAVGAPVGSIVGKGLGNWVAQRFTMTVPKATGVAFVAGVAGGLAGAGAGFVVGGALTREWDFDPAMLAGGAAGGMLGAMHGAVGHMRTAALAKSAANLKAISISDGSSTNLVPEKGGGAGGSGAAQNRGAQTAEPQRRTGSGSSRTAGSTAGNNRTTVPPRSTPARSVAPGETSARAKPAATGSISVKSVLRGRSGSWHAGTDDGSVSRTSGSSTPDGRQRSSSAPPPVTRGFDDASGSRPSSRASAEPGSVGSEHSAANPATAKSPDGGSAALVQRSGESVVRGSNEYTPPPSEGRSQSVSDASSRASASGPGSVAGSSDGRSASGGSVSESRSGSVIPSRPVTPEAGSVTARSGSALSSAASDPGPQHRVTAAPGDSAAARTTGPRSVREEQSSTQSRALPAGPERTAGPATGRPSDGSDSAARTSHSEPSVFDRLKDQPSSQSSGESSHAKARLLENGDAPALSEHTTSRPDTSAGPHRTDPPRRTPVADGPMDPRELQLRSRLRESPEVLNHPVVAEAQKRLRTAGTEAKHIPTGLPEHVEPGSRAAKALREMSTDAANEVEQARQAHEAAVAHAVQERYEALRAESEARIAADEQDRVWLRESTEAQKDVAVERLRQATEGVKEAKARFETAQAELEAGLRGRLDENIEASERGVTTAQEALAHSRTAYAEARAGNEPRPEYLQRLRGEVDQRRNELRQALIEHEALLTATKDRPDELAAARRRRTELVPGWRGRWQLGWQVKERAAAWTEVLSRRESEAAARSRVAELGDELAAKEAAYPQAVAGFKVVMREVIEQRLAALENAKTLDRDAYEGGLADRGEAMRAAARKAEEMVSAVVKAAFAFRDEVLRQTEETNPVIGRGASDAELDEMVRRGSPAEQLAALPEWMTRHDPNPDPAKRRTPRETQMKAYVLSEFGPADMKGGEGKTLVMVMSGYRDARENGAATLLTSSEPLVLEMLEDMHKYWGTREEHLRGAKDMGVDLVQLRENEPFPKWAWEAEKSGRNLLVVGTKEAVMFAGLHEAHTMVDDLARAGVPARAVTELRNWLRTERHADELADQLNAVAEEHGSERRFRPVPEATGNLDETDTAFDGLVRAILAPGDRVDASPARVAELEDMYEKFRLAILEDPERALTPEDFSRPQGTTGLWHARLSKGAVEKLVAVTGDRDAVLAAAKHYERFALAKWGLIAGKDYVISRREDKVMLILAKTTDQVQWDSQKSSETRLQELGQYLDVVERVTVRGNHAEDSLTTSLHQWIGSRFLRNPRGLSGTIKEVQDAVYASWGGAHDKRGHYFAVPEVERWYAPQAIEEKGQHFGTREAKLQAKAADVLDAAKISFEVRDGTITGLRQRGRPQWDISLDNSEIRGTVERVDERVVDKPGGGRMVEETRTPLHGWQDKQPHERGLIDWVDALADQRIRKYASEHGLEVAAGVKLEYKVLDAHWYVQNGGGDTAEKAAKVLVDDFGDVGDIMFINKSGARGSDPTPSADAIELGGVIVRISGGPAFSPRVVLQAIWRTARGGFGPDRENGGTPGSWKIYTSDGDLLTEIPDAQAAREITYYQNAVRERDQAAREYEAQPSPNKQKTLSKANERVDEAVRVLQEETTPRLQRRAEEQLLAPHLGPEGAVGPHRGAVEHNLTGGHSGAYRGGIPTTQTPSAPGTVASPPPAIRPVTTALDGSGEAPPGMGPAPSPPPSHSTTQPPGNTRSDNPAQQGDSPPKNTPDAPSLPPRSDGSADTLSPKRSDAPGRTTARFAPPVGKTNSGPGSDEIFDPADSYSAGSVDDESVRGFADAVVDVDEESDAGLLIGMDPDGAQGMESIRVFDPPRSLIDELVPSLSYSAGTLIYLGNDIGTHRFTMTENGFRVQYRSNDFPEGLDGPEVTTAEGLDLIKGYIGDQEQNITSVFVEFPPDEIPTPSGLSPEAITTEDLLPQEMRVLTYFAAAVDLGRYIDLRFLFNRLVEEGVVAGVSSGFDSMRYWNRRLFEALDVPAMPGLYPRERRQLAVSKARESHPGLIDEAGVADLVEELRGSSLWVAGGRSGEARDQRILQYLAAAVALNHDFDLDFLFNRLVDEDILADGPSAYESWKKAMGRFFEKLDVPAIQGPFRGERRRRLAVSKARESHSGLIDETAVAVLVEELRESLSETDAGRSYEALAKRVLHYFAAAAELNRDFGQGFITNQLVAEGRVSDDSGYAATKNAFAYLFKNFNVPAENVQSSGERRRLTVSAAREFAAREFPELIDQDVVGDLAAKFRKTGAGFSLPSRVLQYFAAAVDMNRDFDIRFIYERLVREPHPFANLKYNDVGGAAQSLFMKFEIASGRPRSERRRLTVLKARASYQIDEDAVALLKLKLGNMRIDGRAGVSVARGGSGDGSAAVNVGYAVSGPGWYVRSRNDCVRVNLAGLKARNKSPHIEVPAEPAPLWGRSLEETERLTGGKLHKYADEYQLATYLLSFGPGASMFVVYKYKYAAKVDKEHYVGAHGFYIIVNPDGRTIKQVDHTLGQESPFPSKRRAKVVGIFATGYDPGGEIIPPPPAVAGNRNVMTRGVGPKPIVASVPLRHDTQDYAKIYVGADFAGSLESGHVVRHTRESRGRRVLQYYAAAVELGRDFDRGFLLRRFVEEGLVADDRFGSNAVNHAVGWAFRKLRIQPVHGRSASERRRLAVSMARESHPGLIDEAAVAALVANLNNADAGRSDAELRESLTEVGVGHSVNLSSAQLRVLHYYAAAVTLERDFDLAFIRNRLQVEGLVSDGAHVARNVVTGLFEKLRVPAREHSPQERRQLAVSKARESHPGLIDEAAVAALVANLNNADAGRSDAELRESLTEVGVGHSVNLSSAQLRVLHYYAAAVTLERDFDLAFIRNRLQVEGLVSDGAHVARNVVTGLFEKLRVPAREHSPQERRQLAVSKARESHPGLIDEDAVARLVRAFRGADQADTESRSGTDRSGHTTVRRVGAAAAVQNEPTSQIEAHGGEVRSNRGTAEFDRTENVVPFEDPAGFPDVFTGDDFDDVGDFQDFPGIFEDSGARSAHGSEVVGDVGFDPGSLLQTLMVEKRREVDVQARVDVWGWSTFRGKFSGVDFPVGAQFEFIDGTGGVSYLAAVEYSENGAQVRLVGAGDGDGIGGHTVVDVAVFREGLRAGLPRLGAGSMVRVVQPGPQQGSHQVWETARFLFALNEGVFGAGTRVSWWVFSEHGERVVSVDWRPDGLFLIGDGGGSELSKSRLLDRLRDVGAVAVMGVGSQSGMLHPELLSDSTEYYGRSPSSGVPVAFEPGEIDILHRISRLGPGLARKWVEDISEELHAAGDPHTAVNIMSGRIVTLFNKLEVTADSHHLLEFVQNARTWGLLARQPEPGDVDFDTHHTRIFHNPEFYSAAHESEEVRPDLVHDDTYAMDGVVLSTDPPGAEIAVTDDFSVGGVRSIDSLERLFSEIENAVWLGETAGIQAFSVGSVIRIHGAAGMLELVVTGGLEFTAFYVGESGVSGVGAPVSAGGARGYVERFFGVRAGFSSIRVWLSPGSSQGRGEDYRLVAALDSLLSGVRSVGTGLPGFPGGSEISLVDSSGSVLRLLVTDAGGLFPQYSAIASKDSLDGDIFEGLQARDLVVDHISDPERVITEVSVDRPVPGRPYESGGVAAVVDSQSAGPVNHSPFRWLSEKRQKLLTYLAADYDAVRAHEVLGRGATNASATVLRLYTELGVEALPLRERLPAAMAMVDSDPKFIEMISEVPHPSSFLSASEVQLLQLAVRGYSLAQTARSIGVEYAALIMEFDALKKLFGIEVAVGDRRFGSELKRYAIVRGALTNADLEAIRKLAPPPLFTAEERAILLAYRANPSITIAAISEMYRGTPLDVGNRSTVTRKVRAIARRYDVVLEANERIGVERVRQILDAVADDFAASESEATRGDDSAALAVGGVRADTNSRSGSANRPRIGLAPAAASTAAGDPTQVDADLPGTGTEVAADKQPNGPPAAASTDGSTPHTAADNESGPSARPSAVPAMQPLQRVSEENSPCLDLTLAAIKRLTGSRHITLPADDAPPLRGRTFGEAETYGGAPLFDYGTYARVIEHLRAHGPAVVHVLDEYTTADEKGIGAHSQHFIAFSDGTVTYIDKAFGKSQAQPPLPHRELHTVHAVFYDMSGEIIPPPAGIPPSVVPEHQLIALEPGETSKPQQQLGAAFTVPGYPATALGDIRIDAGSQMEDLRGPDSEQPESAMDTTADGVSFGDPAGAQVISASEVNEGIRVDPGALLYDLMVDKSLQVEVQARVDVWGWGVFRDKFAAVDFPTGTQFEFVDGAGGAGYLAAVEPSENGPQVRVGDLNGTGGHILVNVGVFKEGLRAGLPQLGAGSVVRVVQPGPDLGGHQVWETARFLFALHEGGFGAGTRVSWRESAELGEGVVSVVSGSDGVFIDEAGSGLLDRLRDVGAVEVVAVGPPSGTSRSELLSGGSEYYGRHLRTGALVAFAPGEMDIIYRVSRLGPGLMRKRPADIAEELRAAGDPHADVNTMTARFISLSKKLEVRFDHRRLLEFVQQARAWGLLARQPEPGDVDHQYFFRNPISGELVPLGDNEVDLLQRYSRRNPNMEIKSRKDIVAELKSAGDTYVNDDTVKHRLTLVCGKLKLADEDRNVLGAVQAAHSWGILPPAKPGDVAFEYYGSDPVSGARIAFFDDQMTLLLRLNQQP